MNTFAQISDETQKRLNMPLAGGKISEEDRIFLTKIQKLSADKILDTYRPSSLINTPVYENLDQTLKGKADQNSVIMAGKIREILALENAAFDTNFQVSNLIASLRRNKESFEASYGDIFIF